MKIIANTKVLGHGWTVISFEIECDVDGITAADFTVQCEKWQFHHAKTSQVTEVTSTANGISIAVDPFNYHRDFHITGSGKASGIDFGKDDVTEVRTEWADRFTAENENGVLYRLYSPAASQPRPLVLFLHGGGESGSDNWKQMVGTVGAAKIAEDYPDVYVMAPQVQVSPIDFTKGPPSLPISLTDSEKKIRGVGWTREYLAAIIDLIREMIEEGKVDPSRVYVTGLSMGGAGTLRALSVGSGLFAAAAPICPTMTPETYKILCGLVDMKIWISTAYVDHIVYRHKYIVDGIMHLRDEGNNNARVTLYSPEDLAKYGIAVDPELSLQQKFGENHGSWVLTYNHEYGIMDWMMDQVKQG